MSTTSSEQTPALPIRQPLLVTKLHAPQVRANLVMRTRLLTHLDRGLERPLTIVSATAGFGKTTLLSAWWEQTTAKRVPVAWLSLDVDDDNLGRFWLYVMAALERAVPGTGARSLAMLQALQPPPFLEVLAAWINDVSDNIAPLVLVLDDYHLMTDPRIHEAMAYLLDHQPPSLHLFIASRTIPAFPHARLRVRDALVEIGADNLRFTHEEAVAFYADTMELHLSDQVITELQHLAEGWIAAMQLSALSLRALQHGTMSPTIAVNAAHLRDYLWEEVWTHLPVPVCDFLRATAILTRLSAPLCNAVTGRTDGVEMLAMLERMNLFIVPLDTEHRWYRIHQLFTDFLRGRLQAEAPHQSQLLDRRAAMWFAAQQQWSEAMAHAEQTGDVDFECELVEQAAEPMLANGQAVTLSRWMERLPSAITDTHPTILFSKLLAKLVTPSSITAQYDYRHLASAEHHLLRLVSGEDQLPARELGMGYTALALLCSRQYRFDEALSYAEKAYGYRAALSPVWQGALLLAMGGSHWSAGDFSSAEDTYRAVATLHGQQVNRLASAIALANLGMLHTKQGRLREAREDYRRIIELAPDPQGDLLLLVSFAYQGLSTVTYLQNDLDLTERCVAESLRLGEQWAVISAYWPNYLMQVKLNYARGDMRLVGRALAEAERRVQPDIFWMRGYLDAFRVCLDLRQGLTATGETWVAAHGGNLELPPGDYRLFLYTTYVRVLIAGKDAQALDVLAALLETEYVQARVTDRVQVLLLTAFAHRQQGNTLEALTILQEALTLAEPAGIVRIFLDEGEPMRALLAEVATTAPSPFVQQLLAAFQQVATTTSLLIEPLSEQEEKVLRRIAIGESNRQIAAALFIAPSTVKTHINNLYRKLDVSSRTQALARARKLHILS